MSDAVKVPSLAETLRSIEVEARKNISAMILVDEARSAREAVELRDRLASAISRRKERILELEDQRRKYEGTLNVMLSRIGQELSVLRAELNVLQEVWGG